MLYISSTHQSRISLYKVELIYYFDKKSLSIKQADTQNISWKKTTSHQFFMVSQNLRVIPYAIFLS